MNDYIVYCEEFDIARLRVFCGFVLLFQERLCRPQPKEWICKASIFLGNLVIVVNIVMT